MQQNDYLQVGVITSTHGIKGEVKVFPTTDDPNRFRALKDVVLDTGKEQIPLEIEGVKFFKQYVILKFKGIDNINDIENGTIRYVHEETVPVDEYPEIQVIRTTGEQDVTILSLNLNGDEIFWHQKGDTLIFDQPITAKENTVKVIAVIDGRRIVHMPIWEF